MPKLLNMTCCCCGTECKATEQWHNRDNGYSICKRCVTAEKSYGTSDEEIKSLYGVAGVHYEHD